MPGGSGAATPATSALIPRRMQELEKELAALGNEQRATSALLGRARAQIAQLEHAGEEQAEALAESQRQHAQATKLIQEYEGGVGKRCFPAPAAVWQGPVVCTAVGRMLFAAALGGCAFLVGVNGCTAVRQGP